jgi:hypothetical protein
VEKMNNMYNQKILIKPKDIDKEDINKEDIESKGINTTNDILNLNE